MGFFRMISLGIMLALYHSFDYEPDSNASGLFLDCQSTFDYLISGYIVLLFGTNLLEFLISWLSSKGMGYNRFNIIGGCGPPPPPPPSVPHCLQYFHMTSTKENTSRMGTGFWSHCGMHYWELNPQPQR